MKRFFIMSLLFFVALLAACQDQSSDKTEKKAEIVVAKFQKPTQKLYYSGVLSPLTMESILSPVEGRITALNFNYGQFVSTGQELFSIDSRGLTQDYRKSIADYLQKKSAYTNSLEEFRGSKALYKAGVISREEFVNSRSQYRTNQLNYTQSRYAMEKILLKARIDPKEIEQLTIEDATKVSQLLRRQFKHIVIRSTANGIALFPIQSGGSSDNNAKRLSLGDSVKQGQLLLTVGDLTGLSTYIQVNEMNINQIEQGMPAIVTVSAFPNMKFKGYVAAVSSQAKTGNQNDGLSEFPVLIKVPHITTKQQKVIRVGMTAKVVIMIQQQPTILLPINAVFEKGNESMVTVINRLGHRKSVPVVVGFTTPTKVSIVSGIKPGDRVVIPESTSP